MKKKLLIKSLLLSATATCFIGLVGCDKKPMPPAKTTPQKSESVIKYHPSETKGKYPEGQGEPRTKKYPENMDQKRPTQSEPIYRSHPPTPTDQEQPTTEPSSSRRSNEEASSPERSNSGSSSPQQPRSSSY